MISVKPWLWLPPQWAHDLGPSVLKLYGFFANPSPPAWRSFLWRGLVFKNPVGIAGGVDKNAENLRAWAALGCGFIEVGTVTPLPQEANPGKIMARHEPTLSLWNKMGFPSHGAEEVRDNLRAQKPFATPVFLNVGKNRETPNEKAVEDYLAVMMFFRGLVDAFVVNISSPNTKGLRDLQAAETLSALLKPLIVEAGTTPVLLKLSPDLPEEDFIASIQAADRAGVAGFILTNTTLSRISGPDYPPEGGMSGAPLKTLSLKALQLAQKALGENRKNKLLVSVGGVMTPDDVFERLQLGANLVQTYSGLIYDGPGFFLKVAKQAKAKGS